MNPEVFCMIIWLGLMGIVFLIYWEHKRNTAETSYYKRWSKMTSKKNKDGWFE